MYLLGIDLYYISISVLYCIVAMHRIEGKVGSLAFCECSAICRRTSRKSAFSARGCADPVRCLSPWVHGAGSACILEVSTEDLWILC